MSEQGIEQGLVYIYSVKQGRPFVGCGALVEGGFVATCRHVWSMATKDLKEPLSVEIEFPRSLKNGVAIRHSAELADACEGLQPIPDLVLLLPKAIPSGIMTLQIATRADMETGSGVLYAGLVGLDKRNPSAVLARNIKGEISVLTIDRGLRQFTGVSLLSYWFTSGSSGSPLFLERGQQLAGILCLSELGANAGKSRLQEAVIVPGTTIRFYVSRLVASGVADKRHLTQEDLQDILRKTGIGDVPLSQVPQHLERFLDEAQARSDKAVHLAPKDADIEAAISASRSKLKALDTAGARDILETHIATETQRLMLLLKESVSLERLQFNHEGASDALRRITCLSAESIWPMIDLGDLKMVQGNTVDALVAYQDAVVVAEKLIKLDPDNTTRQRDLATSYGRIGDAKLDQGKRADALAAYQTCLNIRQQLVARDTRNMEWQHDLSAALDQIGDAKIDGGDEAGALSAYEASLKIAAQLARDEPENTNWQRDLAISNDRIGGVKFDQEDLIGALESYEASHQISVKLAARDHTNTKWQRELAVAYDQIGDVKHVQGDLDAALEAYKFGFLIRQRLVKLDSTNTEWQRDLSMSHNKIGDVELDRDELESALQNYETSLTIVRPLATLDPANAEWQRDLSIAHDQIGSVRHRQGDLDGALQFYEISMTICNSLAKRDRSNVKWQRDLSLTHDMIGDVKREKGDIKGARLSYEACHVIRKRLAKRHPEDAQLGTELEDIRKKVDELGEEPG